MIMANAASYAAALFCCELTLMETRLLLQRFVPGFEPLHCLQAFFRDGLVIAALVFQPKYLELGRLQEARILVAECRRTTEAHHFCLKAIQQSRRQILQSLQVALAGRAAADGGLEAL